ncbi:peramine synthetase [Fusarium tjaetaba]|uniref:Peramine synthetase n=1 Tax=Fusarium tjaetaba TaxID=1567544 RepID=A0A8H5RBZ6_9HYPO|nr:peramine synthetase [Fusarium tjaetaba]KAF5633025.1 peramine synthetase [Fusarium tjaetaba]
MVGHSDGAGKIPAQDLDQVWEWNQRVPEEITRCVHDIVHERSLLQPSAQAICAWDGDLTYAELDRLAYGLASHLVGLGVSHGAIIPLFFEKSMWTTVSILAVLKAGAAFVVLDPSTPEQRLRIILSQIKAQLAFTSMSNEALGQRFAPQVVALGPHMIQELNEKEYRKPNVLPTPSSTMYLVFTSGSTGTPKGTILTHKNLASALHHQQSSLKITAKTRMYDFCSYSFDVFICNTFATLSVGGCLCVPNELDRQNRLAASIASLKANTIDLTPSVSRILSPEQVPGLEQIIFGGEALRIEDVIPWWEKVRIVSLYGPCECTPNSTINSNPASPAKATSMGKGIGLNTWIAQADDHDFLVPLGSVGELLLEGPLLGSGYLNDAAKTTMAFIKNPKWLSQGSSKYPGRSGRLYKTGDLVKYAADGSLLFINRKDEQVKIRGQRVELAEIEHAIRSHQHVKDAVVVLVDEENQDPWIAGFLALQDDSQTVSQQRETNGNDRNVQHTDGWEQRFNDDYMSLVSMKPESIGRDFQGWTSMYDGRDIDKGEMNEWLDDTIASIRNGKPSCHVLEIGTGSGMILFNLLDGLESYTGLEPSGRAVDFVSNTSKSVPAAAGKVTMFKCTAAELGRFSRTLSPSLVILNSVIQYFPDQAYLLNVIQELVQLKGVKAIFFGDVRSLALHDEFLAARTCHVTGGKDTKHEFRRIMDDMRQAEAELLVDPGFFTRLPGVMDKIEHVEILPKRMRASNELSTFRYEAVIHVKAEGQPSRVIHEVGGIQWIDFQAENLSRESLLSLVHRGIATSSCIGVSNIRHSKSSFASHVVSCLVDQEEEASDYDADWLSVSRKSSEKQASMSAVDLVELADQAGCRVDLSWARQFSQRGAIDAIFHKNQPAKGESRVMFRFPTDHQDREIAALCNQPLLRQVRQEIQKELDQILRARLPAYMVPRAITVLDKIPLNDNGKVDRRALRAIMASQATGRELATQPVSEAEGQIRDIWGEVLGIEPATIAPSDSFFMIGGNSIAAMKLVGLARKAGVELSVRHLLQYPRLQDLVRAVA